MDILFVGKGIIADKRKIRKKLDCNCIFLLLLLYYTSSLARVSSRAIFHYSPHILFSSFRFLG